MNATEIVVNESILINTYLMMGGVFLCWSLGVYRISSISRKSDRHENKLTLAFVLLSVFFAVGGVAFFQFALSSTNTNEIHSQGVFQATFICNTPVHTLESWFFDDCSVRLVDIEGKQNIRTETLDLTELVVNPDSVQCIHVKEMRHRRLYQREYWTPVSCPVKEA